MSIPWRKDMALAFVIALAFGLVGVFDAVSWWIAGLVAVVVVLLIWPDSLPRVDVVFVRIVGAVLVAVLALAGLNVLTNAFGLDRLPIPVGLALAVLVFWGVAGWYLWRNEWKKCPSIGVAGALAVGLVVVAPLVVGVLQADLTAVPARERVTSELDVTIVSNGRRHTLPDQLPATPALSEFDVRYSVGVAEGEKVRWTLANAGSKEEALQAVADGGDAGTAQEAPALRPEADAALLLLVDGTAPVNDDPAALPNVPGRGSKEIRKWKRIAAVAAPGVPAVALLQTAERQRIVRWRDSGWSSRNRQVASVQNAGYRTVTDAAVQLAISAPTAQADLTLAMAYRPILLFDSDEPVPWPVSVNALFNEGGITLCRDTGVAKTECDAEPLKHPAELESGGTHLRIETKDSDELRRLARSELKAQRREPESAEPRGVGSAIYVHPVSLVRDERELLYLDYWWYLPDNPVGVGGGALCGAGFVIPGVTCQNHQSDWEGITVVVDRTEEKPEVVAVQYAQHDSVVYYSWEQLQRHWEKQKVENLVSHISDFSTRPLAFVASGTHATYPIPCPPRCYQVTHRDLGEGRHDGGFGWVGNDTTACGKSSCLQMMPTLAAGEKPALWSAYDGPWGERHCFLSYYCDSGSPPTAPGRQERYKHPDRYDGYVDARERFKRERFEG